MAGENTKIYREQGGDTEVIDSGGTLRVKSGGALQVDSGGKVSLPVIAKAADFTVSASESGATYEIGAADVVASLPATAPGLAYTFVVKTPSDTTGLQISPVAGDKIMGNGFTSADDKDAINTAATDREGDSISIKADATGDGWFITGVTGTWARQA